MILMHHLLHAYFLTLVKSCIHYRHRVDMHAFAAGTQNGMWGHNAGDLFFTANSEHGNGFVSLHFFHPSISILSHILKLKYY